MMSTIPKERSRFKQWRTEQMKRTLKLAAGLAALVFSTGLYYTVAGHAASHENTFTPDTVMWGPAPPFLAPGAQLAVIEGDPTASSGDYTVRVKMPDGFRIEPHWHPLRENVTVISGTFKVGMGDTFNKDAMATFPAGSFAFLDPNMHHYAMASGEVVVQIHGMSPVQFNYINPQDDPSKKK
jgi:hypothetical protein